MHVTQLLAAFAAEAAPDSPPATARRESRRLLLDTLGVACGAVGLRPARLLRAEVISWGGAPESSLLASSHRTSAAQAAYVNAYLANLLDADETLVNHAHVANAIVPTALAIAERVGASGAALLDAIAIGYEIAGRIGVSYRTWQLADGQPDWSPVTGYSWVVFGVVAAAGRLLGLDAAQMASAFGIAGYSTPIPSIGKWVAGVRLPNTKYVFLGPLAHAGVAAALLAARGFTGDPEILDGDRGFWRMAGSTACDWDAMIGGLGERWLLHDVAYKWYPACRFFHGPLDLLARIMDEERIEPATIESVEVRLPPAATRPYFVNREPADVVEGSFSVPHAFACLAHRLPVGPAWHADDTLRRPDIARFRQRVTVTTEPRAAAAIIEQLTAVDGDHVYRRCPTSLRLVAGNRTFEAGADYASGDPWTAETSFSDEKLEAKFLAYTSGALGTAWAREALAGLRRIETLDDVGGLPVFAPSAHDPEAPLHASLASRD